MRSSGILLPVSSLPTRYGIGGFSREAYHFVDQLKRAGQSNWQVLPLGPTGYGDSPYQAFSTFAGNPYYISLDTLMEEGLLTQQECQEADAGANPEYVDYGLLYNTRYAVLRKAYARFQPGKLYNEFVEENQFWLEDYCLFMALKNKMNGACWTDWPEEYKTRRPEAVKAAKEELADEIAFFSFLQYKFMQQWTALKAYANSCGIRIIGDIPIYVAFDNSDAWSNPELFQFDENCTPTAVAGCPPDAFSEDGQLWGNPLYRWDVHKETGYAWWIQRVKHCMKLYDVIRVDHFRGFDEYYSIPYGDTTAKNGKWEKGPGIDLFNAIEKELGKLDVIAEDLGTLTDSVVELVKESGFPGMKVLQFAFSGDNENVYLPHNYEPNCVVYTGTHDNNTTVGWYKEMSPAEREFSKTYMDNYRTAPDEIHWDFIRLALSSIANLAIIPMQDYLGLGSEARLNFPSTMGENWKWRMLPGQFNEELVQRIHSLAVRYSRIPKTPVIEAGEEQAETLEMAEHVMNAVVEAPLQEEVISPVAEQEQRAEEARELGFQETRVEDISEEEMEEWLENTLKSKYGRPMKHCTRAEIFDALMMLLRDRMESWPRVQGKKKLYYISAEFLMGKLLSNNLINMNLYRKVDNILRKNQLDLGDIEEIELEPSLGNGGLGRLAACFLDSIATLGLYGDGVGLNYHYGLFRQMFVNNKQSEVKNTWLTENSWLIRQSEHFQVPFRNFTVESTMYDITIPGYHGKCNRLHLFDLDTVDDSMVGDDSISFDQSDIRRCLTLFLYPDDSTRQGQLLRIYQQYFMVSNAAQLILKECADRGVDLHDMPEHVVIQINDTHPSMIIPEMIRLLQERGFSMDEAIDVVSRTCAYTNHTILAEALEKWPMDYLEEVVPHLLPIIHELNNRVNAKYNDPKVAIIDETNRVHMAHMDIHYGFSVNGVAALHTDILKKSELNAFYKLYPGKFNNKTNGITFRRWLLSCNRPLTDYLTELIGEEFRSDAGLLKKLRSYEEDQTVLDSLEKIKRDNKKALAQYLYETQNIDINVDSIFDVQIKRLHEYKRQQMNALYVIYKYLDIKAGNLPKTPITMFFGAKAAPAYTIAKDIIHLILCLSQLISEDPEVSPYLKVVMIENYNVTKAAKLIPAADVSEQISLASKEASGTGNMKFMLNGAVTLGTEDGANVEIHELVGDDNIYIFGKMPDEVIRLYDEKAKDPEAGYNPKTYYENNKNIRRLVDFIVSEKMMETGDPVALTRLFRELTGKDWFMTLLDLEEYITVKEKMFGDYEDRTAWNRKALINIAEAGYFSSDRTIADYNRDIWHLS